MLPSFGQLTHRNTQTMGFETSDINAFPKFRRILATTVAEFFVLKCKWPTGMLSKSQSGWRFCYSGLLTQSKDLHIRLRFSIRMDVDWWFFPHEPPATPGWDPPSLWNRLGKHQHLRKCQGVPRFVPNLMSFRGYFEGQTLPQIDKNIITKESNYNGV